MNDGATLECQQWLAGGGPIVPVLFLCMAKGLPSEKVLDLQRSNRDAIDEDDQVDRVLVLRAVGHLPNYRQQVGFIQPGQIGIQARSWLEVAQVELDVGNQFDAIPQHNVGRVLLEGFLQALQDFGLGLSAVVFL